MQFVKLRIYFDASVHLPNQILTLFKLKEELKLKLKTIHSTTTKLIIVTEMQNFNRSLAFRWNIQSVWLLMKKYYGSSFSKHPSFVSLLSRFNYVWETINLTISKILLACISLSSLTFVSVPLLLLSSLKVFV